MEYAVIALVIVFFALQYTQIREQQRTIRELNDRLMARSYAEYTSFRAREDPPPETTRKPISWYDDVAIDDVDESR